MEHLKKSKIIMQMSNSIKLAISDFDGTLVDTFNANLESYQKAFELAGVRFSKEIYKRNFGVRFDKLMDAFDIKDENTKALIKEKKAEFYKDCLGMISLNKSLLSILSFFKTHGIMVALASTASRRNLLMVLKEFHIDDLFDIIVSGEDVKNGKPAPDVYLKVLENANVRAENALAFEDSIIGQESAKAANIKCLKVQPF